MPKRRQKPLHPRLILLLWLHEYFQGRLGTHSNPLRLINVTFFIFPHSFHSAKITVDQLNHVTFISCVSNEKNNSVKWDAMGHSRSVHQISDPIRIAVVLTLSLRKAGATPDTPLAEIPHGSKWWWIRSFKITTSL